MKSTVMEIPVVEIVDDDDSLRTALCRVLEAAGYETRSYASAADFLMNRGQSRRGCVLLDIRMPGGPSGMELQKALSRQGETLPIIFITGHGDIPTGVQAIKDGAFDFLTKPVEKDHLLNTVRGALAHEAAERDKQSQSRMIRQRWDLLTACEKDVLLRVIDGQLNKQIASDLGCSDRTIKAHRAQAMMKMEASSLADLIHIFQKISPLKL